MTDAGLTRERTLCGVRNEMFRALSSDSYRLFYVTLLLLSVDLLKKKRKSEHLFGRCSLLHLG